MKGKIESREWGKMIESIIEDNKIQNNEMEMKSFACMGTWTNDQSRIMFSQQCVSSALDTKMVLMIPPSQAC